MNQLSKEQIDAKATEVASKAFDKLVSVPPPKLEPKKTETEKKEK